LARQLAANSQIFTSATSHKRTTLCFRLQSGPGLAGSNESCLPGVRRLVESRTPEGIRGTLVSSLPSPTTIQSRHVTVIRPQSGPGLAGSNESCLPGVRRLVESRAPDGEPRHACVLLSPHRLSNNQGHTTLVNRPQTRTVAEPSNRMFPSYHSRYINLLSPELYPARLLFGWLLTGL